MNGVSDTRFSPQGNLSRAHVVTVLYRLDGSPEVSGSSGFDDVPEGWYADAVTWAFQNGIVEGVSATRFNPNGNITREQIATILYRYYVEYLGNSPSGYADLNGYIDGDENFRLGGRGSPLGSFRWVDRRHQRHGKRNHSLPQGHLHPGPSRRPAGAPDWPGERPETGPVFLGWVQRRRRTDHQRHRGGRQPDSGGPLEPLACHFQGAASDEAAPFAAGVYLLSFRVAPEERIANQWKDVVAPAEAWQVFGQMRRALRICPGSSQFARHSCRDADCHTSSLQSPPCPAPANGQSRGNAPLGLLSPQRVSLCGVPCTGSQ